MIKKEHFWEKGGLLEAFLILALIGLVVLYIFDGKNINSGNFTQPYSDETPNIKNYTANITNICPINNEVNETLTCQHS